MTSACGGVTLRLMPPTCHDPAVPTPPGEPSAPTAPPVVVLGSQADEDPALLPFLRARLKQVLPFNLFCALAMLALDVGQGDTFTPLRLAILGVGVLGQGGLLILLWCGLVCTPRRVSLV